MELTHMLVELDITVDQLITVDAAIGFASGAFGASTDFVDRNNTSNVKVNSNHYQSTSRFPVWSQGGKNTASGSTIMYNIQYTGSSVDHYNIDIITKQKIINYLKKWIGNQK